MTHTIYITKLIKPLTYIRVVIYCILLDIMMHRLYCKYWITFMLQRCNLKFVLTLTLSLSHCHISPPPPTHTESYSKIHLFWPLDNQPLRSLSHTLTNYVITPLTLPTLDMIVLLSCWKWLTGDYLHLDLQAAQQHAGAWMVAAQCRIVKAATGLISCTTSWLSDLHAQSDLYQRLWIMTHL